jgi:hypothetical protein
MNIVLFVAVLDVSPCVALCCLSLLIHITYVCVASEFSLLLVLWLDFMWAFSCFVSCSCFLHRDLVVVCVMPRYAIVWNGTTSEQHKVLNNNNNLNAVCIG